MQQTIIVTGGAGFIGSAVIRYLIKNTNYKVVNVDMLKSIKNPHLRGLYFPQFDKKNFNHL